MELKIIGLVLASLLLTSQMFSKNNRPLALAANALYWGGGIAAIIQLPDPVSQAGLNAALGAVLLGLLLGTCWIGMALWSPFSTNKQPH